MLLLQLTREFKRTPAVSLRSRQQDRASDGPSGFQVAMRARRVGKRIALIDRDAHRAAFQNREQVGGSFQHFASGMQIVGEPGAGHVERTHPVEAEQIEGRDQPSCRSVRHAQAAATQTTERRLERAAANTVVDHRQSGAAGEGAHAPTTSSCV